MIHLPQLIEDLALILMSAAVVALVFKKLKQPLVLGYLIAGFIIGPHFKFFPTVKDRTIISIWAEIGVIFMLFGLGLEFSFKKLSKVGKAASITATFEILAMLGVGYLTGQILGWSKMDSLFLGGILSISSTTIIVRAFDELNLKGKKFVSLVFGVLIVEDLIAILLLVLLSSVAVTQTFSGVDLLFSSLKLIFFLVLWFLLGIYLIPIFLKMFQDVFSDETVLIVSIGMCLMMVIVASYAGFSPALGAFVMGSILAETPIARRIEKLLSPVKELFSAIFFVSVGMLINIDVLSDHFQVILFITGVTIIGKWLSTTLGALVSGVNVRSSMQSGMSLAQIGEFSFIIATLGMNLKVTSEFLYPVAVMVSALTTFTTPYLIKSSDRSSAWLEKKIPPAIKMSLDRYEKIMALSSEQGIVSLIWKEYGLKIFSNAVIIIAISLGMARLLNFLPKSPFDGDVLNYVVCFAAILVSAPFLWTIFLGTPEISSKYGAECVERLSQLQMGISIVRFLIGFTLIGFIVSQFISMVAVSGVVILAISSLVIFFFSPISAPFYKKIENRFLLHLSESERTEIKIASQIPQLAPWNATLSDFVLSPNSPLIGKALQESRLKERFGITVAMIERGEKRIFAPKKGDLLFPGDRIYIIGTDEQILSAQKEIEFQSGADLPPLEGKFGLETLLLNAKDPFINKRIRECGIREMVDGIIVGIERGSERYLSPDSSMVLQKQDIIWLVGNRELIRKLKIDSEV